MGNLLNQQKKIEPKTVNIHEVKTYIGLIEIKVNQQKQKKLKEISNKRKEIGKSLMNNQLEIAKLKMENIISDEDFVVALDIFSTLVEILKEKTVYLLSSNKCPEDMRATLDTIIYCSLRFDISELAKLRQAISIQYGSLYVSNAQNNVDKLVNIPIIERLSVKNHPNFMLLTRIKQIAIEEKVDYYFPPEFEYNKEENSGQQNFFPNNSINQGNGTGFGEIGQSGNNLNISYDPYQTNIQYNINQPNELNQQNQLNQSQFGYNQNVNQNVNQNMNMNFNPIQTNNQSQFVNQNTNFSQNFNQTQLQPNNNPNFNQSSFNNFNQNMNNTAPLNYQFNNNNYQLGQSQFHSNFNQSQFGQVGHVSQVIGQVGYVNENPQINQFNNSQFQINNSQQPQPQLQLQNPNPNPIIQSQILLNQQNNHPSLQNNEIYKNSFTNMNISNTNINNPYENNLAKSEVVFNKPSKEVEISESVNFSNYSKFNQNSDNKDGSQPNNIINSQFTVGHVNDDNPYGHIGSSMNFFPTVSAESKKNEDVFP